MPISFNVDVNDLIKQLKNIGGHDVLVELENFRSDTWTWNYYVNHGSNVNTPDLSLSSSEGTALAIEGSGQGVEAVVVLARKSPEYYVAVYVKNRPGYDCKFQLLLSSEKLEANNDLAWKMWDMPAHYATQGALQASGSDVEVEMQMTNDNRSIAKVYLKEDASEAT